MSFVQDMKSLDLLVSLLVFLFLVRGLWIGCIRQLAAFVALVGGYLLAGRYADQILPWIGQWISNPKLAFLVSLASIFLAVILICTLIGRILQLILRVTLLGWLDRLCGALLGFVQALVVASLVYMVLASTLSSTNSFLREAWCSPYLRQGGEILQSLISDPKLRGYFLEKAPAILPDLLPQREKPGNEEEDHKEPDSGEKPAGS